MVEGECGTETELFLRVVDEEGEEDDLVKDDYRHTFEKEVLVVSLVVTKRGLLQEKRANVGSEKETKVVVREGIQLVVEEGSNESRQSLDTFVCVECFHQMEQSPT